MTAEGEAECPFCKIVRGETGARIVFQDSDVLAFFPNDPATLGHTLVIPRKHVRDVWALDPSDAAPLWEATQELALAVRRAVDPDGLNIINSAGKAATQTVLHMHIHVVPRWYGDPIGDIWPPKEPYNPVMKDQVLDDIQHACQNLRL